MRGCSCRGTNGLAHVSCLASFARSKYEEDRHVWTPWESCMTCKQLYHGGVKRPSGIETRWSRLCHGLLQDDDASMPTPQTLSKTGFVSFGRAAKLSKRASSLRVRSRPQVRLALAWVAFKTYVGRPEGSMERCLATAWLGGNLAYYRRADIPLMNRGGAAAAT